jgi:hypothetical protein
MVHADYKMGSTAYAQVCPRGFGTCIALIFDIALLGLSFAPPRVPKMFGGVVRV